MSSELYKDEDAKTYLLDIGDLRREPLRDLRDDLLNERLVLHRLPRLHDTVRRVSNRDQTSPEKDHGPDDGRLDDVLAVLINGLEHVGRLGLLLGLDRHVQVDTDLL